MRLGDVENWNVVSQKGVENIFQGVSSKFSYSFLKIQIMFSSRIFVQH